MLPNLCCIWAKSSFYRKYEWISLLTFIDCGKDTWFGSFISSNLFCIVPEKTVHEGQGESCKRKWLELSKRWECIKYIVSQNCVYHVEFEKSFDWKNKLHKKIDYFWHFSAISDKFQKENLYYIPQISQQPSSASTDQGEPEEFQQGQIPPTTPWQISSARSEHSWNTWMTQLAVILVAVVLTLALAMMWIRSDGEASNRSMCLVCGNISQIIHFHPK